MGLLRIYLAICVLAAHSGVNVLPWPMHSSVEAVQIFFLISGFYMALISGKYKSALEFYASRFLRIFIPYYVILGIVLLTSTVTGLIFGKWLDLAPYIFYSTAKNGLLGVALTAISNLTLFFQDWVMFFTHEPGQALAFSADLLASPQPLYRFLLVQQAWTIGIELTFYLLVPLLSRLNTWSLWLIAAASLGMRIFTYQVLGLTEDPFRNRFFPFELLLFVVGMISYRIYSGTLAKKERLGISSLLQYLLYLAIIVFLLHLAQQIPLALYRNVFHRSILKEYTLLISYAGWAAIIPVLYHLTRKMQIDRFIGELSYPVYLLHILVIEIVDLILVRFSMTNQLLGVISAVLTVSLSALLYLKIFRPFEERRPEFAREFAERWSGSRKRMKIRPENPVEAGRPE